MAKAGRKVERIEIARKEGPAACKLPFQQWEPMTMSPLPSTEEQTYKM